MVVSPKHNITSTYALDLIMSGQSLKDYYVTGKVELTGLDDFDMPVEADNCIFEHFEAISSLFLKKVKLTNSDFKDCSFMFSYFPGGLEIDNCSFDSYLDFQSGGHNKEGKPVFICNSTFKNFVNFFDCWYESEVVIKNNDFQQGTNLLGKPFNIPVTFDVKPIIENNKGQLAFDNEGDGQ